MGPASGVDVRVSLRAVPSGARTDEPGGGGARRVEQHGWFGAVGLVDWFECGGDLLAGPTEPRDRAR
ncbi:hypothetical protein GCM10025868_00230 [Angustibacter aerolatus]|uniref:Uncharacterized protein n=1 Tax=Angustibacter aerolatus TaxID=1162965 RepID=A0ABQ6J9C0_9ACTN|nr:hypothetical protein GCM10025868_00230 [Angustibacter aerolatus]